MTATPNQALQRTRSAVTAPAADRRRLSAHRQVPRRTPPSLSLGSLGDSAHAQHEDRLLRPEATRVEAVLLLRCGCSSRRGAGLWQTSFRASSWLIRLFGSSLFRSRLQCHSRRALRLCRTAASSTCLVPMVAFQCGTCICPSRQIGDGAVSQVPGGENESTAPADVQRGRRLLRHRLFRRLRSLQALDALAFVQINQLPHTLFSDRCMSRLSWVMTGGTGWLLILAVARLLNRRRGWRATLAVAPALWLATATVDAADPKMVPPPTPLRFAGASDHRRPQAGQLLLPVRPQRGSLRRRCCLHGSIPAVRAGSSAWQRLWAVPASISGRTILAMS